MRAVLTRVSQGRVSVGGETVGAIERGVCILVGVGQHDDRQDMEWLAEKVATARIFADSNGKLNLSVKDTGGQVLAVSQFTLYGDMRKGRRPSFATAMLPEQAETLFNELCEQLRQTHRLDVSCGRFGAHMQVETINDGPVTLLLDSKKQF